MQETIARLIPSDPWETFQWGVTLVFLLILVSSLVQVFRNYRIARGLIEKIYDLYLGLQNEERFPRRKLESEIETQDFQHLLERRRDGASRKVKLHFIMRRDREEIRSRVEAARSRTESMPIIGILGTIFGLVVASMGQESIQAMTGGIWIALTSSLFALTFTLIVKSTSESTALSDLENLEDLEEHIYDYVFLHAIDLSELEVEK